MKRHLPKARVMSGVQVEDGKNRQEGEAEVEEHRKCHLAT